MIPAFNASLVLPPFSGAGPVSRAATSPYKVSIGELVERFATSTPRVAMLHGLMSYRRALLHIGIVEGFQWINGSFVENIEASLRQRAPADIDIVTFGAIPLAADSAWLEQNGVLFDRAEVKKTYSCDAFFIDLGKRPALLVDDSRYWFGLFSHQRESLLWKGMLQLPMLSDDADAMTYLATFRPDEEENPHA